MAFSAILEPMAGRVKRISAPGTFRDGAIEFESPPPKLILLWTAREARVVRAVLHDAEFMRLPLSFVPEGGLRGHPGGDKGARRVHEGFVQGKMRPEVGVCCIGAGAEIVEEEAAQATCPSTGPKLVERVEMPEDYVSGVEAPSNPSRQL